MANMEGEKAVEIFDLVVKNRMLPAKLDKLIPLSFIGQAAVTFYRSKVKAMTDLGMTEEQQKATLSDGQDAGKMLLAVEARIGELLPSPGEMDKERARRKTGLPRRAPLGSLLPEGISHERSKCARAIARNPEAVAMVIAEAEENEDIPTKTAVLNRIRYEQEKARVKKVPISELVLTLKQNDYLGTLDKIISILPPYPPKDWNQKTFAYASAKAEIIIGRLEVFRHGDRKSIPE